MVFGDERKLNNVHVLASQLMSWAGVGAGHGEAEGGRGPPFLPRPPDPLFRGSGCRRCGCQSTFNPVRDEILVAEWLSGGHPRQVARCACACVQGPNIHLRPRVASPPAAETRETV